MRDGYAKNDRVSPFSNGTEHMMWEDRNCRRGEKGCRNYRPNASSSKDGCPIEVAVAMAACSDGKIPARIALRGGFVEPGSNGRLLPLAPIQTCPEYRGYDEPDDRPRRAPKPPAGQLDIFDPRNSPPSLAPTREPVHA